MKSAQKFRIGNYVNYHGGDHNTFCKAGQPRHLAVITNLAGELIGKKTVNVGVDYEAMGEAKKYYHQTIEPIEITEDWLTKLGLKKDDKTIVKGNGADFQPDYPRTIYKPYVIEIHDDLYFGIVKVIEKYIESKKIVYEVYYSVMYGDYYRKANFHYDNLLCKTPVYVHQLQNLYFALTGKELFLKD